MDFESKTFLLGVGAQKTGTSWLYRYFSHRDDVYMSPIKELHFFDEKHCGDVGARTPRERLEIARAKFKEAPTRGNREMVRAFEDLSAFNGSGEAYRNFFRKRVPEGITRFGEITPSYALLPREGFAEIAQLFRDVRLIFIMRDPVERFYSHIRYVSGKRPPQAYWQKIETHFDDPGFVGRSSYQNTIMAMESVFGDNKILYLFYETMFSDETVRAICDFAGLKYVPANVGKVVRPSAPRQELPPELERRLRDKFQPTYAYCRDRFGDAIPDDWRRAD